MYNVIYSFVLKFRKLQHLEFSFVSQSPVKFWKDFMYPGHN